MGTRGPESLTALQARVRCLSSIVNMLTTQCRLLLTRNSCAGGTTRSERPSRVSKRSRELSWLCSSIPKSARSTFRAGEIYGVARAGRAIEPCLTTTLTRRPTWIMWYQGAIAPVIGGRRIREQAPLPNARLVWSSHGLPGLSSDVRFERSVNESLVGVCLRCVGLQCAQLSALIQTHDLPKCGRRSSGLNVYDV